MDLVLKNAKQKGYKPYAKSPQTLPDGLPQDICLLMLKDPDGNFVEIVGPNTKKLSANIIILKIFTKFQKFRNWHGYCQLICKNLTIVFSKFESLIYDGIT